jgi:hypothetical protein
MAHVFFFFGFGLETPRRSPIEMRRDYERRNSFTCELNEIPDLYSK